MWTWTKRVVLIGCCAWLCFGTVMAAETVEADKKLPPDARVAKLFKKWDSVDSPGAAVAVVKDGLVVYRGGFGSAQLEYNIPITPSTVFHVASLSKQFTAMAITLLEEEGKLSVDDDIRKHLPEMPDLGKTVTIRHLLHHTSGMRDQWELLIMSGWRMDDIITQKHILDLLKGQKELNFTPGERRMYCNAGYTLLAEIVSRAGGKPFTRWTAENILEPLGMTSSHFHRDHDRIVKNRAYSYVKDKQGKLKKMGLNYANVGATSLFTTVEDMANWMRNFEEKRVGNAAVMERLLTRYTLNNGKKTDYARGIWRGNYKGLEVYEHSGGDAGFRANMMYFPGPKLGIVVMANLGAINPYSLCRPIADIFLEGMLKKEIKAKEKAMETGKKKPKKSKKVKKKKKRKVPRLKEKQLKAFVGTYWAGALELMLRVELEKGKLYYIRSASERMEMVPLSKHEFELKGTGFKATFSGGKGGIYRTVTLLTPRGRPPLKAERAVAFEPGEEMLKEYAGVYYSPELDFSYRLVIEKGKLYFRYRNADEKPLQAQVRDHFTYWNNFFKVRFERDSEARLTGFRLSGNRARNVRFDKVE